MRMFLPTYKEEALTAQSSNIDRFPVQRNKGFTGSLKILLLNLRQHHECPSQRVESSRL
jgi:hypothetical protein